MSAERREKSYLHDGSMGDIIYALPVLREEPGRLVLTRNGQFQFLGRLLGAQPYVTEVCYGFPEDGQVDLRRYRGISNADLEKHLVACHAEAAEIIVDAKTPWLNGIEKKTVFPIIINRTPRYRGVLNYAVLRDYVEFAGFIGKKKEWVLFRTETDLDVRHIPVEDGLEMAELIAGSSLFIGNQSLAYAMAEAMKHPRVLEVSHRKPNCGPLPPNGYRELTLEVIEKHVH